MNGFVSVEQQLPVVVGVDGGPAELEIVDAAAAEAARRGVVLEVVHAWPGRHGVVPRRRTVRLDVTEGRHLLELAVRRVRNTYAGLRVRTELVDENAAEALIRRSRQAGLLVIRHRDESGLGHGWGSTAAYLAHHCACPLLVYRGASPERGPVVAAASGRYSSAMSCAFEAAARAGCPLVLVHVREPGESRGADPLEEVVSEGARSWPDVTVNRLSISEAEIGYTTERASRRGRLLVAGRGRKGWLVEQLYSATSITTGGHRLCPVLLLPAGVPAAADRIGTGDPVGQLRL
jgi:nucleotide-binding universal stress UspA family protein